MSMKNDVHTLTIAYRIQSARIALHVSCHPQNEPEAIDIREFLLGASTFIEMDKSQKTRFVFDLYDDDRSGFLSQTELVQVLRANHMQSSQAVTKKVQTIMKHVDADGSGTLSYDVSLLLILLCICLVCTHVYQCSCSMLSDL